MKKLRILLVFALFAISGTVMSQTQLKSEVTAILEEFCSDNYDNYFYPRQYVVGTLNVIRVDIDEANEIINVKGTHTCRGRHVPGLGRKTYPERDFKAELAFTDRGLRIKFWRWFEPVLPNRDGYWEGPCERTIGLFSDF